SNNHWQQPLHSLHEALNYKVTHDLLILTSHNKPLANQLFAFLHHYAKQQILPILETTLSPTTKEDDENVFFVEQEVTRSIQQAIQWAGILKTVLADAPPSLIILHDNDDDMLEFCESFLHQIMTCRMVPVDSLSNLGMAYSRVVLLLRKRKQVQDEDLAQLVDNLVAQQLSDMTTIAMIQGLAATAPIKVMLHTSPCFMQYFQRLAHHSDPGVRLVALKGIHTLISRCYTLCIATTATTPVTTSELEAIQDMTEGTLEMVLAAWENPPNRRLGSAIQSLFQKLIALMQELGQQQITTLETTSAADSIVMEDAANMTKLVMRLLAQPSNRRGRYKALETLLPIVGARKILEFGGKGKLMEALLGGIGDRNSHSAGVIADLWEKILSDLLLDMLLLDTAAGGLASGDDDNKGGDPKVSEKKKPGGIKDFSSDLIQRVLPKWWDVWVPNLASALLSETASRRKHVASFCLPRVVAMVGGRKRRQEASSTFACLLRTIHSTAISESGSSSGSVILAAPDRELWATLEVIRHAHMEKLVDNSPESASLNEIIQANMTMEKFRSALKHSYSAIRLVAFQTIRAVVNARGMNAISTIEQEIELWKESFPYATSSDGKEYMSSLMQCLIVSLDRIANEESASLAKQKEDDNSPENGMISEPRFLSFARDFLVFEVAMGQTAYPGSICEKESFAIELLEHITDFAAREPRFATKNAAIYERKWRASETEAANQILDALLSRESLATIFSLMHSQWDGTRSAAYRLLFRLVLVGESNCMRLPVEFTSAEIRSGMMARAVFLASSPRQRESDTGARVLAFLYFSLDETGKWAYLKDIVDLLETRLSAMKVQLASLLSGKIDPESSRHATRLPLAHGLIHSLQLIISQVTNASSDNASEDSNPEHPDLFERMAQLFCQAIQVSLNVVADLKEGAVMEGMDEDIITETTDDYSDGTPLNVNTGAIGANGTFSLVNPTEKEEHERRIAIQRIVMGSWLLTKETCEALATLLTSSIAWHPSDSILKQAGGLLISTLISLKHAGAAFAASRALQQIAEYCFNSSDIHVGRLPSLWANRLLDEISSAERVRDSTLRRSTGYALGFLAIMRSEVSSNVDPHRLCPFILAKLVQLTIPPRKDLEHCFDKLKLPQAIRLSFASEMEPEAMKDGTSNDDFEIRRRVHALNVLRLIILDAPLAREVGPIIGSAFIWGIIGYYDSSWAVRNSSTMVFAASMLRTVDADKNAKVVNTTSSNAITAAELFKSYPLLPTFLTAVLVSEADNTATSTSGMSTPPAFPILLLLSRIQPMSSSGIESRELTEPFIPLVYKSLRARHLALRSAASRALSNLCSGSQGQCASSVGSILDDCHWLVVDAIAERDWNAVHGGLLGIKHLCARYQGAIAALQESGLLLYFSNVTKAGMQQQPWPPLCTSVVLEILEAAHAYDAPWNQERESTWQQFNMSLERPILSAAGASELAITNGEILCRELVPRVWDTTSSDEDHEKAMSTLLGLLTSKCLDVRLYACKAFKKSIYESIDCFVARRHGDCSTRLQKILNTLLSALESELNLTDEGHAHPPCLRRLSRCLLECIDASVRMNYSSKVGFLTTDQVSRVFAVGQGLLTQDGWLDKGFRRETPLSGNGAEIISFGIAWSLQQTSEDPCLNHYLSRMKAFVTVVGELNDPRLSWRVRHSAAVSVQNSTLLQCQGIGEEMKQLQHQVLQEVLIMLQDPDPDVRSAATSAAQDILDLALDPSNRHPLVSQRVLEETYQRASTKDTLLPQTEEYVLGLLTGIHNRCQGLDAKIETVLRELKHTEASVELDQLINAGTERKIFEDEGVNDHEEPLLANQLAIHSILHSMSLEALPPNATTVANKLINQCQSILSRLKDRHSRDLLHEVTRFNSVFAEIHSLITVAACLVFLGANGGATSKLAAEMVGLEGSTLHPSVKRALQILASMKMACPNGHQDIHKCLFLLPATMRTM
ncbi:adenoma-associated protein homolog (Partial), partial [Seminavis robusta]